MNSEKSRGQGVKGSRGQGSEKNLGQRFTLHASHFTNKGFTLIELIIVIILAGILVAAIVVRISLTPSQTANITAVDQAVADIQYVQMLAFGNRLTRSVVFTNGSATYIIRNEASATIETKTLPSGTTAGTSVTFTFNSLGELTGGSDQTLSLGGRTITIYRITGKVVVT